MVVQNWAEPNFGSNIMAVPKWRPLKVLYRRGRKSQRRWFRYSWRWLAAYKGSNPSTNKKVIDSPSCCIYRHDTAFIMR